jgi:hypothetical protein
MKAAALEKRIADAEQRLRATRRVQYTAEMHATVLAYLATFRARLLAQFVAQELEQESGGVPSEPYYRAIAADPERRARFLVPPLLQPQ